MRRAALALLLLAAACDDEEQPPPAAADHEAEAPPAPPPAEPSLDPRDQYELARAMVSARQAPEDDRPGRFEDVRDDWLGKRVRWEMLYIPTLCRAADHCNANLFDHGRGRVALGLLPGLRLTAAEHTRLGELCGAHETCVFTAEGTIAEFVFDPLEFPRIVLGDVHVVSARASRPDEQWFAAPIPPGVIGRGKAPTKAP